VLLALDTSAEIAVALVPADADDVTTAVPMAERREAEQRRHAELLAPLVAEVLAEAGADRRDVRAVVVGTGPAPFTGLRAGLVTARTFAFALGVPVHGVCSLDALAAQAYRDGAAGADDEVLVVTDARRREVYHARYAADAAGGVVPLGGPGVLRPADLVEQGFATGAVVVGPGAALHAEHLAPAAGAPVRVEPAVLAVLARQRVAAGLDLPTEPLYLRRPDVTPAAGRKRATG
jgi:tRNA threonylcarbamoyladenosine biosynthesis protein TsaB